MAMEDMSITKRQGVGGDSKIRRLAKIGSAVLNREALTPDSRNGRRVMARLRKQYGDEAIDAEIKRLEAEANRTPAPDHKPGKIRRCQLCQGELKPHEYQMCDSCDMQTG